MFLSILFLQTQLTWFRDGSQITENTTRVTIMDNGWKLQIEPAKVEDATRYSCKAENVAGDAEKYYDLSVLGRSIL